MTMNSFYSRRATPSLPHVGLRIFVPVVLLSFGSACVLTGIEPDEIDVVDEGETGATAGTGDEDEQDESNGDGDGDGDPTGPGDGDGDGAPGGDGDGEPGDGDGDFTCFGLPVELDEGKNIVEIEDGDSALSSSCGGDGPETVYEFIAPSAGTWQFAISGAEFSEVLTLLEGCNPPVELICSAAPASVEYELSAGQTVYVVVDSEAGSGTANLDVTKL